MQHENKTEELLVKTQPYTKSNLRSIMKAGVPVKITDFPNSLEHLREKKILTMLKDFAWSAAYLKNDSLDTSGKNTFTVKTFTGNEIRTNPKLLNDFYFSEPIQSLPEKLKHEIPYPFGVNSFPWFRGRLWYSRPGGRTPLHRDIPYNFIMVTEGAKNVILAAPRMGGKLYPCSFFSHTPNFAKIDLRNIDYERFPLAKVGLQLYTTTILPGEMLYIPPLWWHDVRNEKKSISLNFWFAPIGGIAFLAWLSAVAKKVLGVYRYEYRKPEDTKAI